MEDILTLSTEREGVFLRQLATKADDIAYWEAVKASRKELAASCSAAAHKYNSLEDVRAARLNAGTNPWMGIWQDGTFLGTVNATPSPDGREAEIGYWTDSRHTGHNYATIAARALAKHFANRHTRVFAEVAESNHASVRVLQKAGFYQTAEHVGWLIFDYAGTVPGITLGGIRGPGNKFHPVLYDLDSPLTECGPDDDSRTFAMRFTDGAERRGNGALIEVDPGAHTEVIRITKAKYRATRQVIQGEGLLLTMQPNGKVEKFEVSAHDGRVFELRKGWVNCWVAGPNGLTILDSSQPAFQLDFERAIVPGHPRISPQFWQLYREVVERPSSDP